MDEKTGDRVDGTGRIRLYVVRHGQTEWNRTYRWQGQTDIPLTDEGRAQAARLAKALRGLGITRIYASPLVRAAETAQIIRRALEPEMNADIVYRDDLKEIALGKLAGLTKAEMAARYGETFRAWLTHENAEMGLGEENEHALQTRAFGALTAICEATSETTLVVGHSGWINALLRKLLHIPLCAESGLHIDNAGITAIDYDPVTRAFKISAVNAASVNAPGINITPDTPPAPSHRFFRNTACQYFPCHETADSTHFNCLFCYCPLYALGAHCGGHFTYKGKDGRVKSCMGCSLPHDPAYYDKIMDRLTQQNA